MSRIPSEKHIKVIQTKLVEQRAEISALRLKLLETKKALQEAEARLEELNDPIYFYGGSRITQDILTAQHQDAEAADHVRTEAFKEIGRLRAALDKIAKWGFPSQYALADGRQYAAQVLTGTENQTQD